MALQKEKTLEAHKWASEALEIKPKGEEGQRLMAKVLDREIAQEKSIQSHKLPEDLIPEEKKLQIKTWLERSQSFLQMGQFDQALLAAEQVFQLDPNNLEASRLVDEIKETARAQGKDESLFLQDVYQEEIQMRTRRYVEQAENWIKANQWGAARLAIEKTLLLDPRNADAHRLLAKLQKGEAARSSSLREAPGGK